MRMLLCCEGCGTLWKVPPVELEATIEQLPRIADWRDFAPLGRPAMTATSSKRCPLCGGDQINIWRCR